MCRFKVIYTVQTKKSKFGSLHTDIKTAYVTANYKDEVSLVLSEILETQFKIHEIIEVFSVV